MIANHATASTSNSTARQPRPGTAARWPAWTDQPIPYRLAAEDAEFAGEVERHARRRGGMARLTGPDAD